MAFTDWIADEQLDEVEIEEDVTSEEASEVEEAIEAVETTNKTIAISMVSLE